MSPQPSPLTFLTVDLEGSTALLRSLGPAYADVLRQFRHIVESTCLDHGGRLEFSEGDGVLAVFSEPTTALEAAVAIATSLGASAWPPDVQVRGRMGIHTGTAASTDDGLVGMDVHRASRIGNAAQGGQLLLSAEAFAATRDLTKVRGWPSEDLGWFVLAGLDGPEQLWSLQAPGLDGAMRSPRARRRFATSIPVPAHSIVGRGSDLDSARELVLRPDVRLVTITGPGGTGKTRFGIELARSLESEFRDGVVFIDLSAVTSPDRTLATIGRWFGIREAESRTLADAFASVIGDAQMLWVLDNMEQIVGSGTQVGRLLERLPNVRVLVTSRQPLRIGAEHEYPLGPLLGSDGEVDGTAEAAIALFGERARLVDPNFTVDDDRAPTVEAIVRRLDGLPLAIELAAARLRTTTAEALLAQLDHRLDVLNRSPVDAPERHKTMWMAINWSHDLLDDDERTVFRRFGVFANGAPVGAIASVCCGVDIDPLRVTDIVEELVTKSLVVFGIGDDGAPRYRMLETIREFALEHLSQAGEDDDVRRRHLGWVAALTSDMREALPTPGFNDALDTLDRERFNLRQALRWSIDTQTELELALTAFGEIPVFWDIRGYVAEAIDWAEQLLATTEDLGTVPGRAMTFETLAWLALLAGDPERSEEAYATAEAMWRDIGDPARLGWSLALHAMTTYNLGDLATSRDQFEEAIELARRVDMAWLSDVWCVFGLGHIALSEGRFDDATADLESVLTYSREHGLPWGVGHAQFSLGVLAFIGGNVTEASDRIVESCEVRRDLNDLRGIADCLGMLAIVASAVGEHDRAATLLGASDVIRDGAGHQITPWQEPFFQQATAASQSALGPAFDEAYQRGRSLSGEARVELAIAQPLAGVAPDADG